VSRPLRTTLHPFEAVLLTLLCFGLFIVSSLSAVGAGFPDDPFTDSALVGIIVTELVLGGVAVAFLALRGYDVASLWPMPTLRGSLAGVGLFFGVWLVGGVLTWPLHYGPEQPIDKMVHDAVLSLPLLIAMAMVNGAFEEIFLLGALLRGLRHFGVSVALGVPLLVRVSYHLYQGPVGVIWVLGAGLAFSLYYLRHGKLWPVMFAHTLWDIVPFMFQDR
jgi:membrane protease YdiL (CAAX protease family)